MSERELIQPTGSALRKAALKAMVSNDTPMTRVEYLIASIDDVSATCSERGYFGACSMLDNLSRIANDVKLSISQNNKVSDGVSRSDD